MNANLIKDKNQIYTSDFNEIISFPEEGYDQSMTLQENSFWYNHRNSIIQTVVKRFAPTQTFYDIGGGNGYVSKGLKDIGLNTILIEPGYTGCLNAKKRGVDTVVCSTIENSGFEENSIESVGLFDVVEHIENDKEFLMNVQKYMKIGSYIFITVPSYKFLWSKDDSEGGHFRRYTKKQMNNLLKEAGFKNIYSTYFFSLLIIPILLFRTLPSKLNLIKNSLDHKKQKNEHKNKRGIIGYFLNLIFDFEKKIIKNNNGLFFGSSLLVVAKKNS